MKLSNKHLFAGKPKGFTLVELLVVIAIISTLGAISYGPIMRMLNNAEITKSNKVCKDLTAAVDSFQLKMLLGPALQQLIFATRQIVGRDKRGAFDSGIG